MSGAVQNTVSPDVIIGAMFQYVLNVTHDLPNVFEADGKIRYMQIPIADHWSQDLGAFFPRAIQFIGQYTTL